MKKILLLAALIFVMITVMALPSDSEAARKKHKRYSAASSYGTSCSVVPSYGMCGSGGCGGYGGYGGYGWGGRGYGWPGMGLGGVGSGIGFGGVRRWGRY